MEEAEALVRPAATESRVEAARPAARRRVAAALGTAVATALTVGAALLRRAPSLSASLNVVTHCPKSTCYECTNGFFAGVSFFLLPRHVTLAGTRACPRRTPAARGATSRATGEGTGVQECT